MKNISAKFLSVILAITLIVCALPLQTMVFAEQTPPDVVFANEEEGITLDEATLSQEYVKVGKYSLKTKPHSDGFFASQYFWRNNKHFEPANISAIVGTDKTGGALRFWVYVKNISDFVSMREKTAASAANSYVKIGTKKVVNGQISSNPDDSYYASWNGWMHQIQRSGWNEVVLKFSDAAFNSKTNFNSEHIDFFTLFTYGTSKDMWIDNIRVSADTSYTPVIEERVMLIDDETCTANANGVALLSVSDEQAKVGSKSLKSSTNGSFIAYAGFWGGKEFEPVIDISEVTSNGSDGAFRFWFYIDDVALLNKAKTNPSGAQAKIGSGKDPDNNNFIWTSWINQVTKSGWNEIVLKFTNSHKTGTPNPEKINTLCIKFPDSTQNMEVFLDDICVTSDTSSTSCVELPIIGTKSGVGASSKPGRHAFDYKNFSVDVSKVEDKYLKLSLYIARTDDATAAINDLMGEGRIDLTSAGKYDENNRLTWDFKIGQQIYYNLVPGWNTLYLPFNGAMTGQVDPTKINYFRIYNITKDASTSLGYHLKVRDVSVISHDSVPAYALPLKSESDKGYYEKAFERSVDASNLKNPHLQLSFYVARTDDESSIEGLVTQHSGIELTSYGWCDNEELFWCFKDYNIQPGWNTVSLPFAMAGNQGSKPFDITAIDYFRIFTVSNPETVKFTVKIKDVSIVDCEDAFEIDGIYGNGMLFQQNKDVVISGSGRAYDNVNVSIVDENGKELQATNSEIGYDGRFTATLKGLAGGYAEYDIIFKVDGNIVGTLEDVVFGELWLASGQSNMEWRMMHTPSAAEILANPTDKYIKVLLVPRYGYTSNHPYAPIGTDIKATWGDGTNASVIGNCSAIGYYQAVELRKQLDMPIGIINANMGATNIYGWLSRDAIESDETVLANAKAAGYYISEGNWNRQNDKYLQMSAMYNIKIAPLANFSIAGTIWYQGCANVNDPTGHYEAALELLLKSYSEFFGFEENSMPLIVSHLHPYSFNNLNAAKFNNEFTAFAAKHPVNVAQITNYDQPLEWTAGNSPIHPNEKNGIGKRMGIAAAGLVYGKNDTYTSPSYKNSYIEDNAIFVEFKNLGSSVLAAKDGKALDGFAIAGADGVYMPAKAEIVAADTVKVWNITVTNPVAVTYAYTNLNYTANLVSVDNNGDVLFAVVPFCSNEIEGQQLYRNAYWLSTETLKMWYYENDSASWQDIWNTDSSTVTLDSVNKTDGASSLKVSYDYETFSISPKVYAADGVAPLERYGRVMFDIKTSNELQLTLGKTYVIKASDKWQRITIDLSEINDMSQLVFNFNSSVSNGEINIDNLILLANLKDGDLNNDTYTNSADLVLFKKILLGVHSEIGITDINKDAYSDVRDLVRLKKMLVS